MMRLCQVNMCTPRIRVGQKHKSVLCEKRSVRPTNCRTANRAAEAQKQTGNLTCSLALVCACTNSSLATCNTGSSLLPHHGICPLPAGTQADNQLRNKSRTDQWRIASQQLCSMIAVHRGKISSQNSCVSMDPTHRSQNQYADVTPANSNSATPIALSFGTRRPYPQQPCNQVSRGNTLRTDC